MAAFSSVLASSYLKRNRAHNLLCGRLIKKKTDVADARALL